jgi:glycosyltransferase involved in cell wall biosynthesis
MAEAVEAAQVVLVPSLWPETFGIVGIEAMAHARPVVAYDAGGIAQWLRPGETGCLVPRGDVAGMRAAVAGLIADPIRCRTLGDCGRRRVAQAFLAKHHLARLLEVAEVASVRWRIARQRAGGERKR